MTHKKLAGIAVVLILLFGVPAIGAGVLNTPSTGYLLCIDTKSNVVTHPGTATCPKGTKGLVVGSKGQDGAPGLTGATGLNAKMVLTVWTAKLYGMAQKILKILGGRQVTCLSTP